MPQVLDWKATEVDGGLLRRQEFIGTGNLPLDRVRSMAVKTNHPAAPVIKVSANPDFGETIRVFTRRSMPMTVGGQPEGPGGDVVVIEIANAVTPGRFVRMYLRNDGIVLSSEEVHG